MEGLGADDDRVEPEAVLVGVPVTVVDAAEQAEQAQRVEAAAVGDAVLAVGGEDVVLLAERTAGADLGRLLAEQLGPDAELAVPLQRGRLGVDPAHQHHVAVEAADLVGAEVEVELGVVHPLALRRQQLDQLGPAVTLAGTEDVDEIGTEDLGSAGFVGAHGAPSRGPVARGLRSPGRSRGLDDVAGSDAWVTPVTRATGRRPNLPGGPAGRTRPTVAP